MSAIRPTNQITEEKQECCGVNVSRDYEVSADNKTLRCPDCGTTYTRESIYETPRTPEGELILRPCPFCGEPAAWGEGEQKTKYGNEQVYCSNCYAMTAPEGTKEEAAFLWNDRNDPNASLEAERDALLAEVGRLQEAADAAVKAERERCARIAETHSATDCDGPDCGVVIAAAIREGKPQE